MRAGKASPTRNPPMNLVSLFEVNREVDIDCKASFGLAAAQVVEARAKEVFDQSPGFLICAPSAIGPGKVVDQAKGTTRPHPQEEGTKSVG